MYFIILLAVKNTIWRCPLKARSSKGGASISISLGFLSEIIPSKIFFKESFSLITEWETDSLQFNHWCLWYIWYETPSVTISVFFQSTFNVILMQCYRKSTYWWHHTYKEKLPGKNKITSWSQFLRVDKFNAWKTM